MHYYCAFRWNYRLCYSNNRAWPKSEREKGNWTYTQTNACVLFRIFMPNIPLNMESIPHKSYRTSHLCFFCCFFHSSMCSRSSAILFAFDYTVQAANIVAKLAIAKNTLFKLFEKNQTTSNFLYFAVFTNISLMVFFSFRAKNVKEDHRATKPIKLNKSQKKHTLCTV